MSFKYRIEFSYNCHIHKFTQIPLLLTFYTTTIQYYLTQLPTDKGNLHPLVNMVSARFFTVKLMFFTLQTILCKQVMKSLPHSRGGELISIYINEQGFMNTYFIWGGIIQYYDYLFGYPSCSLIGYWELYALLTCPIIFVSLVLFLSTSLFLVLQKPRNIFPLCQ